MIDESFVDAASVLDESENWARESLHDNGYSDAFIDAWLQFDDGLDFETALELLLSEDDCKLLLIRRIQELRDQISNGDQSLLDGIVDGHLIARLELTGSWNEIEENWLRERQRRIQKPSRKRISLAKIAVHYILGEAPMFPGTVQNKSEDKQLDLDNLRSIGTVSSWGRDLKRFKHYVGIGERIKVNGTSIEITSVENRGKIIGYVFENCDLPSNQTTKMTPMSTIRSIICGRKNKLIRQRSQR